MFKTEGLNFDALIAIMDSLEPELRIAVGKSGLRAAAGIVLRSAQKKAPIGTGRISRKRAINIAAGQRRSLSLRDTGYAKSIRPKAQYKDWASAVGFSAYHAYLVEHGHGGPRGPAKPHPYLQPAIRETDKRCVGAIEKALAKAMPEIRRATQRAADRVQAGKQYMGRNPARKDAQVARG